MSTTTLNRVTDKNNNIQYPPQTSHQLVIDGIPIQDYSIDEVEQLALAEILRLRDTKTTAYFRDLPISGTYEVEVGTKEKDKGE